MKWLTILILGIVLIAGCAQIQQVSQQTRYSIIADDVIGCSETKATPTEESYAVCYILLRNVGRDIPLEMTFKYVFMGQGSWNEISNSTIAHFEQGDITKQFNVRLSIPRQTLNSWIVFSIDGKDIYQYSDDIYDPRVYTNP